MGKALANGVRVRQPQLAIECARIPFRLGPGFDPMADRRFDRLVEQPVGRIECCRRTLGDIGNSRSAQRPSVLVAGRPEVDAVEYDPAGTDAAPGAGETHGGEAEG